MSTVRPTVPALGDKGYVQTSDGARFSFSKISGAIYRFLGKIFLSPGSDHAQQAYFLNPWAAKIAEKATRTGDAKIVNTRPISSTESAA